MLQESQQYCVDILDFRKHLAWLVENTELWITGASYDFLLSVILKMNEHEDTHVGVELDVLRVRLP